MNTGSCQSRMSRPAAMYGEDSSGRKVSLLNNSSSSQQTHQINGFTRPKRPAQPSNSTSSTSSCRSRDSYTSSSRSSIASSPRHSPPTPPLVRHDSRSSLHTPSTESPMTPNFGFDPIDPQQKHTGLPYYTQFARHGFPPLQDGNNPYYNLASQQPLPPLNSMADMADYGMDDASWSQRSTLNRIQTHQPHQVPLQQNHAFSTDPSFHQISPSHHISTSLMQQSMISKTSQPTPVTPTTANNPDAAIPSGGGGTEKSAIDENSGKPSTNSNNSNGGDSTGPKKKYPCPHATRYACADTFTTSGHAARHGKKHTGEKNIICPTCNKAFTRKDNMKQHERTHRAATSRTNAHSAGSASPALSANGINIAGAGSRRASCAAGEAMEIDGDGSGVSGNRGSGTAADRPRVMRSELSEILEHVQGQGPGYALGGRSEEMDADADADGEGESPGLDALATVAAGALG